MDFAKLAAVFGVLSFILVIICVAALFILLKKNNNKDYAPLLKQNEKLEKKIIQLDSQLSQMNLTLTAMIRDEFKNSRSENASAQSEQRKELSDLMDKMTTRLEKLTKDSADSTIKMQEMISDRLDAINRRNEEKLEQMRVTVDEKLTETLGKRLDTSFKTVSDQLENLYKSLGEMKTLSTDVTGRVSDLNRILTNVKARGTWAEVQLQGLLDQTIPGMYDKNVKTNSASRNIVEFAVKIPSSEDKDSVTYLPIDSKFPVESYIRLCDAADRGDSAAVEAERKALEATIISQAREVKKYINEPATTPFAIMYLATEGLYSEVISSKSGIAERCHSEFGVMIAGPSTITALLNSLSIGFKAMAINEKAKEVREVLAATKAQYDKFGGLLDKARKKITEAGNSLDDAQKRNDMIQRKLKGVETIDQGAAAQILGLDEETESE